MNKPLVVYKQEPGYFLIRDPNYVLKHGDIAVTQYSSSIVDAYMTIYGYEGYACGLVWSKNVWDDNVIAIYSLTKPPKGTMMYGGTRITSSLPLNKIFSNPVDMP